MPSIYKAVDKLLRKFPFQFSSRATRYEFRFTGNTADVIQRRIWLTGAWDREVSDWYCKHLTPGTVFVDIGANVGYFSVLAATKVAPGGRVFAYEPIKANCAAISKNLELNDLGNVEISCLAIGNTNGTAKMRVGPPGNSGQSAIVTGDLDSGTEVEVACGLLDDALPNDVWSRVLLIKIDVEGEELNVLYGARQVLKALQVGSVVLVEVTPDWLLARGQSTQELFEYMRLMGYEPLRLSLGRLSACDTPEDQTDVFFRKEVVLGDA